MVYSCLSLPELMNISLPPITAQKRLYFRPSIYQIHHVYELLNYHIFDSELRKPALIAAPRRRKYWGMCVGGLERKRTGSFCEILLMDKWISVQWMVAILAHEMAHQYQWDIIGPDREEHGKESIMSHGPTFFQFRDRMEQYHIPLKTAFSQRKWYKHQDLFKT